MFESSVVTSVDRTFDFLFEDFFRGNLAMIELKISTQTYYFHCFGELVLKSLALGLDSPTCVGLAHGQWL